MALKVAAFTSGYAVIKTKLRAWDAYYTTVISYASPKEAVRDRTRAAGYVVFKCTRC